MVFICVTFIFERRGSFYVLFIYNFLHGFRGLNLKYNILEWSVRGTCNSKVYFNFSSRKFKLLVESLKII